MTSLERAALDWICSHNDGETLYVKDAFIAGVKWMANHIEDYIKVLKENQKIQEN